MKKFISVLLSTAMVLTAVPVSLSLSPVVQVSADEETTEYADATQYTYTITPILAPFEYYIYVETDNPDPLSFAFADYDDVYTEDGDDTAYYALKEILFVDVEYEDEDTYRVNGGYIFSCKEGKSDGGELSLMQTTGVDYIQSVYNITTGASGEVTYYEYEDTGITVTAPAMVDYIDYLIDNYTSDDQSFFEKMNSVSDALYELAVYPRDVYDSDKPTGYYPMLKCSVYDELSLLDDYSYICEEAEGMLLSYVYPYVLDSAGYPGALSATAKRLEPSVEVSSADVHYMITVTYNGETGYYGGSGTGGNDPLYSVHVGKLFTFDGSDEDFSSGKTLEEYCSQLLSYEEVAEEDAEYYRDLVAGDTFLYTIADTGGTWLSVGYDGAMVGTVAYAYVVPTVMYESYCFVSGAWVDGRYIGENECTQLATFDDHPTADIVVSDMTYTDVNGVEHTQDVIFYYDCASETWIAGYAFTGYMSYDDMPDEFILTADEVALMNVDANYASIPESGLIYNGTEFPGTEFTNTLVTGIEADEKVEVTVGQSASFNYTVIPENATYQEISYSSDDGDIAYIVTISNTGELKIYGEGIGTTTITLTTDDGLYETTIEVTVIDHIYSGDYIVDKVSSTDVVIVEYTGTDTDVVIPSEIDGYKVVGIDDEAFYQNEDICSVTIPEGVTYIGDYAFYSCYSLENVTLPDSLTEIGVSAFSDCIMEDIYLSDNITEIGDRAFRGCDSLKSVTLPSGITNIGEEAFAYCFDLASIWIPASVTNIEEYAFYNCTELDDVYFEGTEEEWNAITIGDDNRWLTSANIHYNSSEIPVEDTTDDSDGDNSADTDLSDYTLGDINGDGFIDYLDAMTALRYDAELITLEDEQALAGDVNGDGAVDSLDAILILRYDAGLIENF